MTIKKNHHMIPKFYLKEFVDSSKPNNFSDDALYQPTFWEINKSLEVEPVRKSPKNSFGKNRFYKLDKDTDENQVVEETLSKIEKNFNDTLQKLKEKILLTEQDLINLIVFVETLYLRTERQIEHWQNKINEFERIYREVDQAHNNAQKYSDDFFKGSHEIGKKFVIAGIGAMGKLIIKEGLYILFNQSEMPFISSDSPVLWTHGHIDELRASNIPINWLKEEIKTNQKQFFCYCPLTPKIAIFSSPFFKFVDKQICSYWETTNMELVFSMNYLTQTSANEVIIANKPNPYGDYEKRVKDYLESTNTLQHKKGKQMLFYTSNARYLLKVEDYEHIFDNPSKTQIKFWTNDFETLKLIFNDKFIESVQLYEDGLERSGARRLMFFEVSLDRKSPSVIVQF
jgi:hypothetical protein